MGVLFQRLGLDAVASCSTPIDRLLFKGYPLAPQCQALLATATHCVICPSDERITK